MFSHWPRIVHGDSPLITTLDKAEQLDGTPLQCNVMGGYIGWWWKVLSELLESSWARDHSSHIGEINPEISNLTKGQTVQ